MSVGRGAILALAAVLPALNQTHPVKVLFEFHDNPSAPYSLAELAPGQFVGATDNFTSAGNVVFQIDIEGHYKTIATLAGTNAIPYVAPIENGKLFGMWFDGGNRPRYFHLPRAGGAIQELTEAAGIGVASQWPFGAWERDGVYAPFPSFIGRIGMPGKVEPIFTFTAQDGVPNPFSSFAMTPDGTFYGENRLGSGAYLVYRVTRAGRLTRLAELLNTGGPWAPLVVLDDGTVYGAEAAGGSDHKGSIYKIDPSGQFSVVAEFPSKGMSNPSTLFVAADGNLYGSTNTMPSYIFVLETKTGKLAQVASSTGWEFHCTCQMIQGSDGKIYGTSRSGGVSGGGTIFSIDAGIAPPRPRVTQLAPQAGKVGAEVELRGSYLLGTTGVRFAGMPVPSSDISVPTANVVRVHVPPGAQSGAVQLTTVNGTTVSLMAFTVE